MPDEIEESQDDYDEPGYRSRVRKYAALGSSGSGVPTISPLAPLEELKRAAAHLHFKGDLTSEEQQDLVMILRETPVREEQAKSADPKMM